MYVCVFVCVCCVCENYLLCRQWASIPEMARICWVFGADTPLERSHVLSFATVPTSPDCPFHLAHSPVHVL